MPLSDIGLPTHPHPHLDPSSSSSHVKPPLIPSLSTLMNSTPLFKVSIWNIYPGYLFLFRRPVPTTRHFDYCAYPPSCLTLSPPYHPPKRTGFLPWYLQDVILVPLVDPLCYLCVEGLKRGEDREEDARWGRLPRVRRF